MFDLFLSLPILLFLDQLLLDIDSKSSNQFEGFVGNGWLEILLTLRMDRKWKKEWMKQRGTKNKSCFMYSRLHLKWSLVSFKRLFKRWILMQKDTYFANIKMITKYLQQSWKIHILLFACKEIFIWYIQLKIFFLKSECVE